MDNITYIIFLEMENYSDTMNINIKNKVIYKL